MRLTSSIFIGLCFYLIAVALACRTTLLSASPTTPLVDSPQQCAADGLTTVAYLAPQIINDIGCRLQPEDLRNGREVCRLWQRRLAETSTHWTLVVPMSISEWECARSVAFSVTLT